ncbi:MAG: hypothetical protein ACREME_12545 [Gemmatimonadales bacterium]
MFLTTVLLLQAASAGPAAEFASPRVRESSGVAVSRAHPGVLWTHNDSGDRPYLHATDLTGRNLGWLRVPGASALDWEDMALGPCPPLPADPPRRPPYCVYLADTGDNREGRPAVTVYAVPEPAPPPGGPGDTLRLTAAPAVLRLRYPDGAHDVEAIYVAPRDGALFLVSKGRGGSIRLYRIGRDQWPEQGTRQGAVATATRVQTLDVRPNREAGRLVTGAAVRPDGRAVALRTYTEIFLFRTGAGGTLVPVRERACDIAGLELGGGGEAIDFIDDSTLVLTSEATRRCPGTIHTVVCPS